MPAPPPFRRPAPKRWSLSARGKVTLKEALLPLARAARRLRGDPGRVVLVLAHMRSGSSLLHHILISNPALFGRGERNRPYHAPADFERLFVDVCAYRRRLLPRAALVCDQVNHGRFNPNEALLLHARVRKVFLLREPRGAIASMVDVLGRHYGFDREAAVEHYLTRLRELRRYAEQESDPRRQFCLTYADLVGAARRDVLQALSEFLELPQPLDERYRTFDFTGRAGDPSARIREGRIVEATADRRLDLPAERLRELEHAYEQCLETLGRHCTHPRHGSRSTHGRGRCENRA